MRHRAESGAAGAAGGGVGERGPEDEAWREELAAAWGQSSAERGALWSEYAAVRTTIRELKDDPALGQFDAAVDRIEKLHEKVQRPLEQLADGEALLDLADVLVSSTKAESREGPTPSEFVTALLRKFGVTASPLDDSDKSFSWSSLGGATSALFMTATGCQTMHGPMSLSVKERRTAVRRKSECLRSRPADRGDATLFFTGANAPGVQLWLASPLPAEPDELTPDQDERDDTDENVVVMFDLIRRHKRAKLEHLVLNRQSFAQTVENIFALSFLVKDGRAEIDVVDNGDHFVAPRNAPEASRKVVNSQFVFRFDTKDWQIMQRVVAPGEELMPHRSSYCGGEYKNTQLCSTRDCSKVVSDSEHVKEDEFVKEDPVEFTNDEAMKESSANLCSGEDTLKKRKIQHVARRLFSADD